MSVDNLFHDATTVFSQSHLLYFALCSLEYRTCAYYIRLDC